MKANGVIVLPLALLINKRCFLSLTCVLFIVLCVFSTSTLAVDSSELNDSKNSQLPSTTPLANNTTTSTDSKSEAPIDKIALVNPAVSSLDLNDKKSSLPDHRTQLLEVFLSLFAVLAVIMALAWFVKRMGYGSMNYAPAMKVKSTLALSHKEKIVIVNIAGEDVVIGVAPGYVGLIKSLDQPIDDTGRIQEGSKCTGSKHSAFNSSFAHTLSQLLKGNK